MGRNIKCLRCGKDAPSCTSLTSNGNYEYEDYHCPICNIILHKQTFAGINITFYVGRPPEKV